MKCMLSAEMCVYTMFLAPFFFSIISSAKYSAPPGAFACVSAQNMQNASGVVDASNNLKLMNYDSKNVDVVILAYIYSMTIYIV